MSSRRNRPAFGRDRALFVAVAAALLAPPGCSRSTAATAPGIPPVIADIAASYPSLQKITPEPIFVNPELAILCRGASLQEVVDARKVMGPHANAAVVIYMNAVASAAFRQAPAYPVGSVIIKEKRPGGHFDPALQKRVRSGNDGVGGMVKRAPGYDPTHGDWEYFYFESLDHIETGRIASCVQCHEGAKATDYVFGEWAERKGSDMHQAADILAKIYEAGFVFDLGPPPTAPGILYDPPEPETIRQILESTLLWTNYIQPRLPATLDGAKLHQNMSAIVTPERGRGPQVFRVRVRLRYGAEPEFEAIKDGFAAYLEADRRRMPAPPASPLILDVFKPK